MIRPDTPENEHERLAALYATGILDTPDEDRFDRVTRIAQRLFDVPIALVSLVDERRQWFKSCIGLAVRETPRDVSFCGHAIISGQCMVVGDTARDERFADNPLVVGEPGIRFYAGYPIRVNGSINLGTLCLIDRAPRSFGADEVSLLGDLTRIVESELSSLEMSVTDALTGLLNRRGFELILRNNLLLSRRNRSASTLVYFDLNKFKQINDRHGHAQGDAVLADFAGILRASFRNSDVVARMGGDEFVVLLNNADAAAANAALTALLELVRGYNADRDEGLTLSFSHGAITFDLTENTPIDDLIAQADRKMYLDKFASAVA